MPVNAACSEEELIQWGLSAQRTSASGCKTENFAQSEQSITTSRRS